MPHKFPLYSQNLNTSRIHVCTYALANVLFSFLFLSNELLRFSYFALFMPLVLSRKNLNEDRSQNTWPNFIPVSRNVVKLFYDVCDIYALNKENHPTKKIHHSYVSCKKLATWIAFKVVNIILSIRLIECSKYMKQFIPVSYVQSSLNNNRYQTD